MKPLYKAHGLTYKDIKPVSAGMSDLYTQLGDGIIAATPGIVAGLSPIPGALRLHAEKGAAYFGPEPEAVEKVLKELPYMARIRITKGTPTFDRTSTPSPIGGPPRFYVRADADAELVYKVTKLLHKNLDNLAGEVRYFKYAQANPAVLTKDINVPFHPAPCATGGGRALEALGRTLTRLLAIGLSAYAVWNAFSPLPPLQERSLFLLVLFALVFLTQAVEHERPAQVAVDLFWLALSLTTFGYVFIETRRSPSSRESSPRPTW